MPILIPAGQKLEALVGAATLDHERSLGMEDIKAEQDKRNLDPYRFMEKSHHSSPGLATSTPLHEINEIIFCKLRKTVQVL